MKLAMMFSLSLSFFNHSKISAVPDMNISIILHPLWILCILP